MGVYANATRGMGAPRATRLPAMRLCIRSGERDGSRGAIRLVGARGRGSRAPTAQGAPLRLSVIVLIGAAYALLLWVNVSTLLAPARLSLALAVSPGGVAQVSWVPPGSLAWDSGVRQGTRVLAVNGRRPRQQDARFWRGSRIVVRLAAGSTRVVDAVDARRGHDTWPLLLLSPWFFLLGTLVVLRAPEPRVGRAAYALFASAAFALALAPGADSDDPVAAAVEWVLVPLFAACFALFACTFPVPRGTVPHGTYRARVPILAGALGAGALSVVAYAWPSLYDLASWIRVAVDFGYLLLGAALLLAAFATVREQSARQGVAIVCAGTTASIAPFALLYLLPTLLNLRPLLASEHAVLALALLPVAFSYAILRHHVVDVPLLQRWLVHGLLWGACLALCAALVWAAGALPLGSGPARDVGVAVILAAAAGALFRGLYDRMQRRLDRLIFKDSYDYRASLQALSWDLSLAGDLDALGASLPSTLRRLMNLDFAVLLVHGERGSSPYGGCGTYQPDMLDVLAEGARGVRERPQTVALAYGYLPVLFAPLHSGHALVGHLCLGPKASGEPFRPQDHALLATLSGHLAAIVRNVQLVDALRVQVATLDALNERLQHAQEEERTRLAADLHDEPLQTALALQRRLAAVAAEHPLPALPTELSQALIAQLRAFCTAMRPAALDDLGLHAALDQLARELATRSGVPIVLDADPEIAESGLSAAAELVLYRATQEAVNNALRHAHARTIQVTLRREAGGVQLLVGDDGRGFAVPDRLDRLVVDGHLGLAGLHERVQHAGGCVRVVSALHEGTVVQVDLPLVGAPL